MISLGENHSAILNFKGSITLNGNNNFNQCDLNPELNMNIISVSLGERHSSILYKDESV